MGKQKKNYPDMACRCEKCRRFGGVRIVFVKKYGCSMTLCQKHRKEFYERGLIPKEMLENID